MVYLSDACEHRLERFSYFKGWSWRFKLPPHLVGREIINFLEWLGMQVNILLGFLFTDIAKGDCLLPLGDNTSAIRWLYGVGFDDGTHSVQQDMSRDFCYKMIEKDCVLYPHHIPGIWNILADSLSRDFHRNDISLIHLLQFLCPLQIPTNFRIIQLPPEITFFILSSLERLLKRQHAQQTPTKSMIGRGLSGSVSWNGLTSTTIYFLIQSQWNGG